MQEKVQALKAFSLKTIQPGMCFVFSLVRCGTDRQANHKKSRSLEVDMQHEWQLLQ